MEMETRTEGYEFALASWSMSTGTILHISFGTLVLGSTLFIYASDAVRVAGMYLGPALACRAILSYEMKGIRATVSSEGDETPS